VSAAFAYAVGRAARGREYARSGEPESIREGARDTGFGLKWEDGKLTGEIVWGCHEASMEACRVAVDIMNEHVANDPALAVDNTLVPDTKSFDASIQIYDAASKTGGFYDYDRNWMWLNEHHGITRRIVSHEFGHALGLGDLPNSTKNFMSYYGVVSPRSDVQCQLSLDQRAWLMETYR